MFQQVMLQSAGFCLHSRPYRETSAIAYLLTREFGKVSIVAKGIKSSTRQRRHQWAALQPFTPVQAQWSGDGDLKTLISVEVEGVAYALSGRALLAGLYLNELLYGLLPEQQEFTNIYVGYQDALTHLANGNHLEMTLRIFEKSLLEHLGYGIAFCEVNEEGHHQGDLRAGQQYRYVPESGFRLCSLLSRVDQREPYPGEHLLKIAADCYDSPEVLRAARQLMRHALASLLGDKLLNSRQLFL